MSFKQPLQHKDHIILIEMMIFANPLYLCLILVVANMVVITTFLVVKTTSSPSPNASTSLVLTSLACAPKFTPWSWSCARLILDPKDLLSSR